jgi:hypothetical protein
MQSKSEDQEEQKSDGAQGDENKNVSARHKCAFPPSEDLVRIPHQSPAVVANAV